MGNARSFTKEKLVLPVLLGRDAGLDDELISRLTGRFGPIDYKSDRRAFDFTHYYDREMGTPITRCFLSFERLVSPEELAGIKLFTNDLEGVTAVAGKRRINLDPGLLSLNRFVLASTKDNGRRIPLTDGIYAEITLVYESGDFRPLEWTYPDFRSPWYREVFRALREIYLKRLNQTT